MKDRTMNAIKNETRYLLVLTNAVVVLFLCACAGEEASPVQTAAPTRTSTPLPSRTATASPSATLAPTATPTSTVTITPTLSLEQEITGWMDDLEVANQAYQAGEFTEAVEVLTKLIESNPEPILGNLYDLRASAYEQLHDYPAAINDYLEAISLGVNYSGTFNNLCWDLGLMERAEEALPYCEKAVEADPSPAYRDSRGLVYVQIGQYKEAITDFQSVVDDYAESTDPELASIYAQRLSWIEALRQGQNPITPEVLAQLRGEVETELQTPATQTAGQINATGVIVFQSTRDGNLEIYRMNPDSSEQTRLTDSPDVDCWPVLSPNGQYIAFLRHPTAQEFHEAGDIWVIRADGSQPIMVSQETGSFYPRWSPDSNKIAFNSERHGWPDLYIVRKDGKEETRLTKTNMAADIMSLLDLTTSRNWSPNGQYIAFIEDVDGTWAISSIKVDASEYSQLTTGIDVADLTWSPDGEKIAFVDSSPQGCFQDCSHDIYWMNPDGSSVEQLTNDPAQDYNPVWSPDGSQLAFVSDRSGNFEIYVLDPETGQIIQLTDDPAFDGQPTWSPDGTWIAFTSSRSGNADIYAVDRDGENLFRLTTDPGDDYFPIWGSTR